MANNSEINKIFKYVYVIYIPAREEYIRNTLKKLNIKATFIPAILIEDLPSFKELLKLKLLNNYFFEKHLQYEGWSKDTDLDELDKQAKNNVSKSDKYLRGLKGKLALQLSYLKIFDLFLKTKADHCLIFEDDIFVKNKNNLELRFKEIFKNELKDIYYDYVNLGRCFDLCDLNVKFSKNLIIESYPLCTHASVYGRKIIEELLRYSLPLTMGGDHINLQWFYLNPKYKCFTVVPSLFYQNKKFESTLGNPNKELPECGK